jgi:hypothetical protein
MSVVMLNVIMLSAINVIMLRAIILSVDMPNVVAPFELFCPKLSFPTI